MIPLRIGTTFFFILNTILCQVDFSKLKKKKKSKKKVDFEAEADVVAEAPVEEEAPVDTEKNGRLYT